MAKLRVLLLLVTVVVAMAVTAPSVAWAHAYLDQASPDRDTVVTGPLSTVELSFTEPVEVPFSIFKVYRLPDDGSPSADDLANLSEDQWLDFRARASALVSQSLQLRGDEADRADQGLVETPFRPSDTISIQLGDRLDPGIYVVMWRVLSIDTHTTQGFYIFAYAP